MNYEMLLLRGLFVACLLVCTLVVGSMLSLSLHNAPLATASLQAAGSLCQLPPDGVICLRPIAG